MLDELWAFLNDSAFNSDYIGKMGEKYTVEELEVCRFFGIQGEIVKNVYVPKGNGDTTEIDVLFITKKGIFVIESKNYSGWIFGDDMGQNWTITFPNGDKYKMYNPIKQNRGHIKWLRQYLNQDVPMFSIIAFSDRCELKKITLYKHDAAVCNRCMTSELIEEICEENPDVLNEKEIFDLKNRLESLTHVDIVTRMVHDTNVNFIKLGMDEDATKRICPKCGKNMVVRIAKKGFYSGRRFYGCTGYPKCNYLENI